MEAVTDSLRWEVSQFPLKSPVKLKRNPADSLNDVGGNYYPLALCPTRCVAHGNRAKPAGSCDASGLSGRDVRYAKYVTYP